MLNARVAQQRPKPGIGLQTGQLPVPLPKRAQQRLDGFLAFSQIELYFSDPCAVLRDELCRAQLFVQDFPCFSRAAHPGQNDSLLAGYPRGIPQSPSRQNLLKRCFEFALLFEGKRQAGTLQPAAGQPASYKTKMPDCYPYADPVEYRVNWTGGAMATSNSASNAGTGGKPLAIAAITLSGKKSSPATSSAPTACTIQPGQGDCWSDPLKDISVDLAWPAAGAYTLTVTPVRDKHGRDFSLEKPAELSVTVQP